MKASIWKIACAVAVLAASPAYVGVSAAAPAKKTVSKPSDSAIDTRIEKRFKADASLKKYDVKVGVDHGVVTLSGAVATDGQKAHAAQLAKVPGVSRVENQVSVDPSLKTKSTSGTLQKAGDKTKEGAEVVVDKTKEGLSKTGEVITDGWITTRVHGRFVGEDLLKNSDIDVNVKDHIVTLHGTVPTVAGRAKAVEIAKGTEGVHRVVDNLKIGPKA